MKSPVQILSERKRLAAEFIVSRIYGCAPQAVKVARNPSGDVEIDIELDDETFEHLQREYGGQ